MAEFVSRPVHIEAKPWSGPDDVTPGVLCGRRRNRPWYYVKTPHGKVGLVPGEKVWLWLVDGSTDRYHVLLDEAFQQRWMPADG